MPLATNLAYAAARNATNLSFRFLFLNLLILLVNLLGLWVLEGPFTNPAKLPFIIVFQLLKFDPCWSPIFIPMAIYSLLEVISSCDPGISGASGQPPPPSGAVVLIEIR